MLYAAVGLLALSQIVGIYGLITRKADLIFSIFMLCLLAAAVVCGVLDLHHRLP